MSNNYGTYPGRRGRVRSTMARKPVAHQVDLNDPQSLLKHGNFVNDDMNTIYRSMDSAKTIAAKAQQEVRAAAAQLQRYRDVASVSGINAQGVLDELIDTMNTATQIMRELYSGYEAMRKGLEDIDDVHMALSMAADGKQGAEVQMQTQAYTAILPLKQSTP